MEKQTKSIIRRLAHQQPSELAQRVIELQAELDKHRWILVSEGLPETREDVLTYENGKLRVDEYCRKHGGYWMTLGVSPTHWRLIILPEGE